MYFIIFPIIWYLNTVIFASPFARVKRRTKSKRQLKVLILQKMKM